MHPWIRRLVLVPPVLGFTVPGLATTVSAAENDDRPDDNRDIELIQKVEPVWPRKALLDCIEGHVELQFLVGEDGRVQDMEILESQPPGVFDEAATSAIGSWIFKPRYVAGRSVSRMATQRLEFQMEGGCEKPAQPLDQTDEPYAIIKINPRYPESALERCIEGYATLSFVVDKDGRVRKVEVIESEPKRVFDRAARAALEDWRFRPRLVDGEPIEAKAEQTIVFDPGCDELVTTPEADNRRPRSGPDHSAAGPGPLQR